MITKLTACLHKLCSCWSETAVPMLRRDRRTSSANAPPYIVAILILRRKNKNWWMHSTKGNTLRKYVESTCHWQARDTARITHQRCSHTMLFPIWKLLWYGNVIWSSLETVLPRFTYGQFTIFLCLGLTQDICGCLRNSLQQGCLGICTHGIYIPTVRSVATAPWPRRRSIPESFPSINGVCGFLFHLRGACWFGSF